MDTDTLCVVCLMQKELMVHLSNQINGTTLQQVLAAQSQIVTASDEQDATKFLCQECTKEMLTAVHFQEKCRKAEQFFERIRQTAIDDIQPDKVESETEVIIHEVDAGCVIQNFDDIIECDADLSLSNEELGDEFPIQLNADINSKINSFKCTDCGKNFSCQSRLTAHIRTHTGERPYPCPISGCSKSFKTVGARKLHQQRHTGEKPYACSHQGCGMRFVEVSNLKRHLNTHLKQKSFICQSCGTGFGRLELLQMHERTHTGEKPFVCHCGKAFTQQGVLAAHKRIHSGEKPHKCIICGSAFIKRSLLKKHMERHTVNGYDGNRRSNPVEYIVIDNRISSLLSSRDEGEC